jgi:hypothetical protein
VCLCPCSCDLLKKHQQKFQAGTVPSLFEQCDKLQSRCTQFTQEPARRQQRHGFPKTSACSCLVGCHTQSPLYSKPRQHIGEIRTISSPGSRDFLYSRNTDFRDNIKYFVTVQDFITPYGRYRNLICHSVAIFDKLQIIDLKRVEANNLV